MSEPMEVLCPNCGHYLVDVVRVPVIVIAGKKSQDSGACDRVYPRFACMRCGDLTTHHPQACSRCGCPDFHTVRLTGDEVCAITGEHDFVCARCGAVPAALPATS